MCVNTFSACKHDRKIFFKMNTKDADVTAGVKKFLNILGTNYLPSISPQTMSKMSRIFLEEKEKEKDRKTFRILHTLSVFHFHFFHHFSFNAKQQSGQQQREKIKLAAYTVPTYAHLSDVQSKSVPQLENVQRKRLPFEFA